MLTTEISLRDNLDVWTIKSLFIDLLIIERNWNIHFRWKQKVYDKKNNEKYLVLMVVFMKRKRGWRYEVQSSMRKSWKLNKCATTKVHETDQRLFLWYYNTQRGITSGRNRLKYFWIITKGTRVSLDECEHYAGFDFCWKIKGDSLSSQAAERSYIKNNLILYALQFDFFFFF